MARGTITAQSGKQFAAEVEVREGEAAYYTLFGPPGGFNQLADGDGLEVSLNDAVAVSLDAEVEGETDCSAMILEYSPAGDRINTIRAMPGERLFYHPRPGVRRVLVAIRCHGVGRARIRSASVEVLHGYYGGVAVERFGASDGSDSIIARIGRRTRPFVLAPMARRHVVFPDVPAGDWQIEVAHEDRYIQQNRSSLIGRIALSEEPPSSALIKRLGMAECSRGHAYSYLGGGRKGDVVTQSFGFSLATAQRALALELSLPIERSVNVNSVVLRRPPVVRDAAADRVRALDKGIAKLLAETPQLETARSLLYADISLNVVDGSSVWLSSMASVLCAVGPCILVAKADPETQIVLGNVRNRENLVVIGPRDLGLTGQLTVKDAAHVVRALDDQLPHVRDVVVRGLTAAAELTATRQFRDRLRIYLTDFYTIGANGLETSEAQRRMAVQAVTHAGTVLTQTPEIAARLAALTGVDFAASAMPPAIPDDPYPAQLPPIANRPIRIGYAGKINPRWGISELLDWTRQLRLTGQEVELTVVANKISASGVSGFVARIKEAFAELGVVHHVDFDRAQSMELMATMDYVWCWRPEELEEHTLELSTKLVEMVANGARCICYPSAINRSLLGEDYPYFVRWVADLRTVLKSTATVDPALAGRVRARHGLQPLSERMASEVFVAPQVAAPRRICFAGHDMKFVEPYVSRLKAQGHEVRHDDCGWGSISDEQRSRRFAEWADIVFCEWGLGNAVWHSQNLPEGKRLVIRCHLQEVGERARGFGAQIAIDRVETVIFVSAGVRDQAVELFGWPVEKTVVVPNFVLDDEYAFHPPEPGEVIHLGMVGIVPQRKRFDRAVDLALELSRRGHRTSLQIKGPRPETLDFMRAPTRVDELAYYREVYDRARHLEALGSELRFQPWGNDVSAWYRGIDHIVSCSDFESFHYALADGVLSGCHPLVWPWSEAETIYSPDWLVEDVVQAADRVLAFRSAQADVRQAELLRNRDLVRDRYGFATVFARLDAVLGLA
ncbi:glycosyltransferase family protein [Novosphingobium huizhouense]|uniref:hypothetical protein n=1 Tax=Novosphingobium huizhouense TaxID=2866625 RepID=UPI001CD8BAAD|nr:hypothetical protein [Novosphingobium huizhouense]